MSVSVKRVHLRRVLLAVLGLCVSLFLQGVGFSTPGWLYAKGDIGEIHIEQYVGLWFKIICDKNNTCVRDTMPVVGRETQEDAVIQYTPILEFQILTSLALAFDIVAIICGLTYRLSEKSRVLSLLVVSIFTSGLSGVLALIAAGKMGDIHLQAFKKEEQYGIIIRKFPFSLFITGIGGVLDSILAIFLIIELHIHTRNVTSSYYKAAPNTSIQMKGEVNNGYQEAWPSTIDTFGKLKAQQSTKPANTSANASPYAVGGVASSNLGGAHIQTQYGSNTKPAETHYTSATVGGKPEQTQNVPSKVYSKPVPTHYAPVTVSAKPVQTQYSETKIYAKPVPTHYAPAKVGVKPVQTQYAKPNVYPKPVPKHYAPVIVSGKQFHAQ